MVQDELMLGGLDKKGLKFTGMVGVFAFVGVVIELTERLE